MGDTPFAVYDCEVEGAFAMHPGQHPRVGYIVSLGGFGLPTPLAKDLRVHLFFNTGADPQFKGLTYNGSTGGLPTRTASVVGVIDMFEWKGGAGDPLKLEFCVSQQNATQIRSLQQAALKTTLVDGLGWWIADYDPEAKAWFEQSYVLGAGTLTGHVNNRKDPMLSVDMEPVAVKEGIGGNVYKVTMEVVPAGKEKYQLHFASSNVEKVVRSWGVLIGST